MSAGVCCPAPSTAPRRAIWAWLAVVALLVANVPLMLCMPLAADAVLYDLQAKTALSGGVLYRDIVEPNLPGIVWCHMAIRSLFGWNELALKIVDLGLVAGIIALLARFVSRCAMGQPPLVGTTLAAFVFVAIGFYCSTPEWVHCQRDIWLMLPALTAFTLRARRVTEANGQPTLGTVFLPCLVEGTLWACAFWIKPYVAVPALAAIAMSFSFLARRGLRPWRWIAMDLTGILCGGAIIGAAGSAWLITSGVWPHFWEMALEWNPTYFANGRSRWTLSQYVSLSRDLAPWCFVHVVAVPVSIRVIWNALSKARAIPVDARPLTSLLAALYLGWLFQAHFLQHPFHYAHTPGIILGAALLAMCWPVSLPRRRTANLAFAAAMMAAAVLAPSFDPQRLAWWPACITRGSQPDVKCALHHRNLPNWVELQPVVEYLKRQNLKDGELTAYNVFLVHLYPELGVRPSTRYVFLDVLLQVFHERAELIHEALAKSPQKFVVCSLLENGMRPGDIAADGLGVRTTLPNAFPAGHANEFPYCLPLVFRSGQYVVYRVDAPLGELNTRPRPLAQRQP